MGYNPTAGETVSNKTVNSFSGDACPEGAEFHSQG